MNRADLRRGPASIVALSLLFAGCEATPNAPGPTNTVLVAAASDLQGVLPEVVRRYEREHPREKVVVTFGSSGRLAEQIRSGARFDLFLAANESYVRDRADELHINRESIRPYAVGTLVMAVRRDETVAVKSISDLTGPEVKKVAIANPDVAPYGAAARQALKKAGIWDEIGPKLVFADSVRQAFQFAETGNADVALVGRALTRGSDVRVVEVDPGLYDPIVQCLGVISPEYDNHDTRAFVRLLTGPWGRSVLESYGFKLPPAASP